MGPLIFVVNNPSEVCQLARQFLESAGYEARLVAANDLLEEARVHLPALTLIPMVGSSASAVSLCRQFYRGTSSAKMPVIFLLENANEEHRVMALESGADDCIQKPFSPRELVARVQAVLRRSASAEAASTPETVDLIIDSWAMKLWVRGMEVSTTALEFRLLEYLARHRGQVFTRDFLLDAVWGDMQFITPRSVDACIRRIREKIESDRAKPSLLKTIRGVGYRLDAIAAWQSAVNEDCDCSACRTKTSAARLYATRARRRVPSAE